MSLLDVSDYEILRVDSATTRVTLLQKRYRLLIVAGARFHCCLGNSPGVLARIADA